MQNTALRRRILYGKKREKFAGKEPDAETGLYYYGARYLDPKTSRWLSGDPALGEYLPSAPVNEEARNRNGSLPGQGGVFNYVNLHAYHYAGNNPVKYVDPDGRVHWRQLVIGIAQTVGGVLTVSGGAAVTTVSGGIVAVGGVFLVGLGTQQAMDGVGKMTNAIFDNKYNGMFPTLVGNSIHDEKKREQVEAWAGAVESLAGIALPSPSLLASVGTGIVGAGLGVPDIVESYNSSSGRATSSASSRTLTLDERFNLYLSYKNVHTRDGVFTANSLKQELLKDLDAIINNKNSGAPEKVNAMRMRDQLMN